MDNFFQYFASLINEWRFPAGLLLAAIVLWQMRVVRRGERLFTLAMATYFFIIIIAYWLLKPIKKAVFIGYYKVNSFSFFGNSLDAAQVELLAKEANLFIAIFAVGVFSLLARIFRRERYAIIISLFYLTCLGYFYLAIKTPSEFTVWMFYLFGDLFVTTMVATFFSFLNDSFNPADARRAYGIIGVGGVLGGVIGSSAVALQGAGGTEQIIVWVIALVALLIGLELAAGRLIRSNLPPDLPPSIANNNGIRTRGNLFSGALLTMQSPYLRHIAGLVLVYEVASVIMDYQFTSTVSSLVAPAELKSYFASVYLFTNFVAIVVQVFLTGLMLMRFGICAALMVLPIMAFTSSALFFAFPVLLWGSLLNTADNAFAYSIQQTARESLYVVTSREEKYTAKAFIDVVVLRFAKGLSIIFALSFSLLLPSQSLRWLSVVVMVLLVLWGVIAYRAARQHGMLVARAQKLSDNDAPVEQ